VQQKILWAEVQKETGRRKSWWTVRDQLADGRYGQAVLDFLSYTDVGRLVPPLGESDAAIEVSVGAPGAPGAGRREESGSAGPGC